MLSEKEIANYIEEDRHSVRKQQARKAMQYYEGRHDIKDYRIFYFDENGQLKEDVTRSNERISHPFFMENVDQTVQYMLSGKEKYVKSDKPELQKLLDKYFNEEFKEELYKLLEHTIIEGSSFLYRYVDKDMRSHFKFADGLNVIEVASKYTKDGKDYVINYSYYKTEKGKEIFKVDVWDDKMVYPYIMIKNKVTKNGKPRHHVLYSEDDKQYYDTFESIPFLRLDNNKKQTSDLKPIKDLIDDYDLMACGLSNNIQDVAEGIYVIKGYNGNDISELTYNIKNKKQVAVGEGGDVEIKTINIPYQARQAKLDLDDKNIYRFGFSFDASKAEVSNVTNVVIKSRYALLEMKCTKKEIQLKKLMRKVVDCVLDEINEQYNHSYDSQDVYFDFERVTPTNELDNANIKLIKANINQVTINTLLNIASVIDNETLLKNICEVLDIDYEEVMANLPKEPENPKEIQEIINEGL